MEKQKPAKKKPRSYSAADKFTQPASGVKFVSMAEGPRTLLPDEAIEAGRARVAAGEALDDVALGLAVEEAWLIHGDDEGREPPMTTERLVAAWSTRKAGATIERTAAALGLPEKTVAVLVSTIDRQRTALKDLLAGS